MLKKISQFATLPALFLVAVTFMVFIYGQESHAKAKIGENLINFTKLARENSDAVVNIQLKAKIVESEEDEKESDSPKNSEDLFRYFFKGFPGLPGFQQQPQRQQLSQGSGFIYDKNGYIITNHHVVKGDHRIEVSLSDRRIFEATLIGSDKRSDIAILKIEAKNLPTVSIGDSSKVEVGQWVMAIGSPFGFDYTVTKGIISAKQRSLPADSYIPFFQTDVPLNPGNSGGPLFDLSGNVIGVNSQIYTKTGNFSGISFAIPINLAINVANQLRDNGRVIRGWLGVYIQEVTSELADSFGSERPRGALVSTVVSDSPADVGGIKVGDIIIEFEGSEINRSGDLPPIVGAWPADEEANLTVLRGGKEMRLNLKIGELPEDDEDLANADDEPSPKSSQKNPFKFAGLLLADLDKKDRRAHDLEHGVKVTQVINNSQAAYSGFRARDIVLSINNFEIKKLDDVRQTVASAESNSYLAFLVNRNGHTLFLTLKNN